MIGKKVKKGKTNFGELSNLEKRSHAIREGNQGTTDSREALKKRQGGFFRSIPERGWGGTEGYRPVRV